MAKPVDVVGASALTERQIEVLRGLLWIKRTPNQGSRCFRAEWSNLPPEMLGRWATPQDFGGMNGSHHSYTAKRLAQMGLVDRYNYHTNKLNHFTGRAKGACVYRITEAGIAALAACKPATGADT